MQEPQAFIAMSALTGIATLVAARAAAARAAPVMEQARDTAVHQAARLGDCTHRVLRVTAVRNRGCREGPAGMDIDGRDLWWDRRAQDPCRGRSRDDRSDRNHGGQGQHRQQRHPSPGSETHGHSLFKRSCLPPGVSETASMWSCPAVLRANNAPQPGRALLIQVPTDSIPVFKSTGAINPYGSDSRRLPFRASLVLSPSVRLLPRLENSIYRAGEFVSRSNGLEMRKAGSRFGTGSQP